MVPNTIDLTSVQTLKKVIYSESFRLGSFWCLKCKTFLIIIYCKLFSLCFLTENNDMPSEMDDIQRALNQAAKSSGENFNTITLSRKYIHVKRCIFFLLLFFLSDEYMEELKDQPTQSDENMLADRLNVLSQAGTGSNWFCIKR